MCTNDEGHADSAIGAQPRQEVCTQRGEKERGKEESVVEGRKKMVREECLQWPLCAPLPACSVLMAAAMILGAVASYSMAPVWGLPIEKELMERTRHPTAPTCQQSKL